MGSKKMCKLADKDYLKEKLEEYKELVKEANYLCKKCGRVAREEKNLCKPERIG